MIRRAAAFLFGNVLAQALGALTGVLLARWMPKSEYALYTIVVTITGALAVLTKGGVHLGFTTILGELWPDRRAIAPLIASLRQVRWCVSALSMPAIIVATLLLLQQNGAGVWYSFFIITSLLLYWIGDLYTRVVDQLLFLDGMTTKVQALDGAISLFRLLLLYFLHALVPVGVIVASLLNSATALARIPFILPWVQRVAPRTNEGANSDYTSRMTKVVLRQTPVEVFYVIQAQIVIFLISFTSNSPHALADFGALTRIAQLLVPVQAFALAFCSPWLSRERSDQRAVGKFFIACAICAIPAVCLVLIAASYPSALLWIIGDNYADRGAALKVCTSAAALTNIGGVFWTLAAHRGWNKFTLVQIPIGLGWCFIAPHILNLGTLEGALWLQGGFSIGLFCSAGLDVLAAFKAATRLKSGMRA